MSGGCTKEAKLRIGKLLIKPVLSTFAALFCAWLLVLGYCQLIAIGAVKDRDASTWITYHEIRHLTRFHGTDVLKITEDEVFIRRNHRWLPVLKRGQG
jgi:hypothetical protein